MIIDNLRRLINSGKVTCFFPLALIYMSSCQDKKYEYDKSGNIVKEYYMEDGKKHGPFKEFYSTGNLKATGTYDKDEYSDEIIGYYRNGTEAVRSNFSKGFLDGDFLRFDSMGSLIMKTRYVLDEEHGERIEYYPNGKVFSKVNYVADVKTGTFTEYWQNGSLKSSGIFSNDSAVYYKGYNREGKSFRVHRQCNIRENYLEEGITVLVEAKGPLENLEKVDLVLARAQGSSESDNPGFRGEKKFVGSNTVVFNIPYPRPKGEYMVAARVYDADSVWSVLKRHFPDSK